MSSRQSRLTHTHCLRPAMLSSTDATQRVKHPTDTMTQRVKHPTIWHQQAQAIFGLPRVSNNEQCSGVQLQHLTDKINLMENILFRVVEICLLRTLRVCPAIAHAVHDVMRHVSLRQLLHDLANQPRPLDLGAHACMFCSAL